LGCYLAGVLLVWTLTIAGAGVMAWPAGVTGDVGLKAGLLLLMLAGAASQFAVAVVNWICTLVASPNPIMRLDFSGGIPAENRALVAVPALLTSEQNIRNCVDQLELRYLANQDDNLLFALLTDFRDAKQETLPHDQRLLKLVRAGIDRLNRRYRHGNHGAFYLFHRPRKWNPKQGVWMGEERKRGKLAALNFLLRTGVSDAFSVAAGDMAQLSGVRYVITLDVDTRLPPRAGRELVGCMAHPLNWPKIDPATRTVVEGHAVLQPRVGSTISEANRSPFSRLLAGDAGIDPYTRQTSDVYQDVFARGSLSARASTTSRLSKLCLGSDFRPTAS
jgi:hypothetical protein